MGSIVSHPTIIQYPQQAPQQAPLQKVVRQPEDDRLIKLWADMHAECATVNTPEQREKCRNACTLAYTATLDEMITAMNTLG